MIPLERLFSEITVWLELFVGGGGRGLLDQTSQRHLCILKAVISSNSDTLALQSAAQNVSLYKSKGPVPSAIIYCCVRSSASPRNVWAVGWICLMQAKHCCPALLLHLSGFFHSDVLVAWTLHVPHWGWVFFPLWDGKTAG